VGCGARARATVGSVATRLLLGQGAEHQVGVGRCGEQLGGDGALAALTPREREVLGLMAEGKTNTAIARSLVVTPGAVEKHISNIFSKLDLPATDEDHRRVLAVLAFLRAG